MQQPGKFRAFINSLNAVDANKIDVWLEDIETVFHYKSDGEAIHACTLKYSLEIDIEAWPHSRKPVEIFMVQLSRFLNDNPTIKDPESRTTAKWDIDISDDKTADIGISIDVVEDLYLIESEQGTVEHDGKLWLVSYAPSFSVVNTVAVGDNGTDTTDASYTAP